MSDHAFPFGDPVFVSDGAHRGRIGIYEDETGKGRRTLGVIKFGEPFITREEYHIDVSLLTQPNSEQLLRRLEHLLTQLCAYVQPLSDRQRVVALQEYFLIDSIVAGRYHKAQKLRDGPGSVVFLSHSSRDTWFVNRLAVDLTHLGHQVWLDEWEIRVGDSIPRKISAGLESADYVAVVMSSHAVASRWVEREWQSKYWDEIERNHVSVLPILLEECQLPILLRDRKYADFRNDYTSALGALQLALRSRDRPRE